MAAFVGPSVAAAAASRRQPLAATGRRSLSLSPYSVNRLTLRTALPRPAQCGRPARVYAAASGDEPPPHATDGGDAPPARPLSASEAMAARLGKDPAEERRRQEAAATIRDAELAKELRRDRMLAVVGPLLGAVAYFVVAANPVSPLTILHALAASSPTPEVVAASDRPTVMEFFADWCGVCREGAAGLSELESRYGPDVNFVVVDASDEANAAMVDEWGVDGIPRLVLLDRKGQVLTNFIGKVPKEIIAEDIVAMLAGKPLPNKGLDLASVMGGADDY